MALSIIYDHEQRRLLRDRAGLTAAGFEFNGELFSGTWIDPVQNILMLRPAWADAEFFSSNTGIYEKLELSAFTVDNVANWKDHTRFAGGGYFLKNAQAGPKWAITNDPLPKNRPMVVTWFSHSAGDRFVQLECGWNNTASGVNGVSLRLWNDGTTEVWKDNNRLGTYTVTGTVSGQQVSNELNSWFLCPCLRRELLVVSNRGGGFFHTFEDIDRFDPDPIITDATNFWVSFEGTADVQFLPAKFYDEGYATSLKGSLAYPPPTGAAFEQWTNRDVFGGAGSAYRLIGTEAFYGTQSGGASLVNHDGTPFVADGNDKNARIRVDLEADGESTPFVVACHIAFAQVYDVTDDSEEEDVRDKVIRCHLEVTDDPAGTFVEVELKRPDELDSTRVAKLKTVSNRPILPKIGDVALMDGVSDPPRWREAPIDEAKRLIQKIRTWWKHFENYQFTERVPVDGMHISLASGPCLMRFLLNKGGVEDSKMVLEDLPGVTIAGLPGAKCGEFNAEIQVGDTLAQWIKIVVDDYAAGFFHNFRPTLAGEVFYFESPETLAAKPSVYTLYCTVQDAIDAEVDTEDAVFRVYRSYDEDVLEPEANDIRVTGWDSQEQRAIQSFRRDLDSIDPTLAPSARPDNWLGGPRKYALFSKALNDQEQVDRACNLMFERLTPVRRIGEWKCEMMFKEDGVPVWSGDKITLDTKGDYIVGSFSGDLELNPDETLDVPDDHHWRELTYTGSITVLPGLAAAGLAKIKAQHELRAIDRSITRGGSEFLWDQQVMSVTALP